MKLKKLDKSASAFDKMALAIAKYIETMDGTAVIVGGVGIGQDIAARKFNYFIKVGITGKMPTKKNV